MNYSARRELVHNLQRLRNDFLRRDAQASIGHDSELGIMSDEVAAIDEAIGTLVDPMDFGLDSKPMWDLLDPQLEPGSEQKF